MYGGTKVRISAPPPRLLGVAQIASPLDLNHGPHGGGVIRRRKYRKRLRPLMPPHLPTRHLRDRCRSWRSSRRQPEETNNKCLAKNPRGQPGSSSDFDSIVPREVQERASIQSPFNQSSPHSGVILATNPHDTWGGPQMNGIRTLSEYYLGWVVLKRPREKPWES